MCDFFFFLVATFYQARQCIIMKVQTCNEGRNSPTNQVVESHGSIVDVSHFADHAVDVQSLQEEPGESAEVEEVQQDGDDGAQKLHRERESE